MEARVLCFEQRCTQEAVRRENPMSRDHVQRMHAERLPDVNTIG
jgi:hypothetical protein